MWKSSGPAPGEHSRHFSSVARYPTGLLLFIILWLLCCSQLDLLINFCTEKDGHKQGAERCFPPWQKVVGCSVKANQALVIWPCVINPSLSWKATFYWMEGKAGSMVLRNNWGRKSSIKNLKDMNAWGNADFGESVSKQAYDWLSQNIYRISQYLNHGSLCS